MRRRNCDPDCYARSSREAQRTAAVSVLLLCLCSLLLHAIQTSVCDQNMARPSRCLIVFDTLPDFVLPTCTSVLTMLLFMQSFSLSHCASHRQVPRESRPSCSWLALALANRPRPPGGAAGFLVPWGHVDVGMFRSPITRVHAHVACALEYIAHFYFS